MTSNRCDVIRNTEGRQTGTARECIISNRCDGIGNGEGRQTGTVPESRSSNRYDGVLHLIISDTPRNGDTASIYLRSASHLRSKVIGIKVIVDAVNELLSKSLPEETEEEGQ